tara:strand:- start:271 stop:630 length:360 start_codon:yes stop_codon:yes gene_type:complete
MSILGRDNFQNIQIDLEGLKNKQLNELNAYEYDAAFGAKIKLILNNMFGGSMLPPNWVTVTGQPTDVASFANAVGNEKNYLDTVSVYGLDDPRTYRDKAKLDGAVSSFERTTGLKWPFK